MTNADLSLVVLENLETVTVIWIIIINGLVFVLNVGKSIKVIINGET